MPLHHIYLMRHAQYTSVAGPEQEADGPLSSQGIEQALCAAERFASLPISVIHHSTAARASETAAIVAARLPAAVLQPSDILRECVPPLPPIEQLTPEAIHFMAGLPAEVVAAGRDLAEGAFSAYMRPRLAPASDDLHELIVFHGNLMSYFVARMLGAPPESWWRTDVQHCGVSEVVFGTARGIVLAYHNDASHLPSELRSYV